MARTAGLEFSGEHCNFEGERLVIPVVVMIKVGSSFMGMKWTKVGRRGLFDKVCFGAEFGKIFDQLSKMFGG